jgi:hypothetical protein
MLPLPTPTYWFVVVVCVLLLVASLAAATGRAPRLLGAAVAVLYFEWMLVAMSYGKVDHDRFGYLVLLAVLPTVGAARWGDETPSERAGWALRVTQISAICTYFLASWAKLRFGGLHWLTGATLTRAVLRRGTIFSDWTVHVPGLLVVGQFLMMGFELLSPVVLALRGRWQLWAVAGLYGFHVIVYASLTIAFWPHLIALAAFLPLEKVRPVEWARARRRRAVSPG